MRYLLFFILGFSVFVSIFILGNTADNGLKKEDITVRYAHAVQAAKLKEALLFCRQHSLDTSIAFFVDMSIHSGKKRFFITDLQTGKITASSLCCHGMGRGSTGSTPVFSNDNGSYCTSLGKYTVNTRACSQWGIHVHYKMHGMETSNNNALKRVVVLHSYDPVSEEEIYPDHLPMGWSLGCPVISNNVMTSVDGLLKERKRSVLLWIYR